MGAVLGDLASLGYDAEWHCIPASAVGAPHQRDRVWIVAYPCEVRCDTGGAEQPLQGPRLDGEAFAVQLADTEQPRLEGQHRTKFASCGFPRLPIDVGTNCALHHSRQWSFEPELDRVADGVPNRVDRIAALGNAVVPQIPEMIGRAIMASLAR